MSLKCGVHQLGATATSSSRFEHGEFDARQLQAAALGDVGPLQVATSDSRADVAAAMTVPRHGDLDDLGRVVGDAVPPRSSKAARRGVTTVAPHRCSDAGGIGEWSVIDEIDAGPTSPPSARPNSSTDSLITKTEGSGLRHRDDAVMPAEMFIEHVHWTERGRMRFLASGLGRVNVRDANESAPKSREGGSREGVRCGGCLLSGAPGWPARGPRSRRRAATPRRGRRSPPRAWPAAGWPAPAAPAVAHRPGSRRG